MTYAELAAARGIDHISARRLASRKMAAPDGQSGQLSMSLSHWRKASRSTARWTRPPTSRRIRRRTCVVSGFEAALAVLSQRAEAANRVRSIEAEARATAAERLRPRTRVRAEAEAGPRSAEAEAARLREADQLRRARGILARVRAAWRRQ